MAQLDPAARVVPQVVVLVNPLVVGLMAMLLILTTEDVAFINVKVWRTLVPTATLPALQEVGERVLLDARAATVRQPFLLVAQEFPRPLARPRRHVCRLPLQHPQPLAEGSAPGSCGGPDRPEPS